MAKKPKPPTLEELDARVAALERHNGWLPSECPPASDYIDGTDAGSVDAGDGTTADAETEK